jgi:NAD-dependent dihydropyrimidine dehydrogenase PreA subunit
MQSSTETTERRPVIDPDACVDCGTCVEACPRRAIQEPSNFCCAKCAKYCQRGQRAD